MSMIYSELKQLATAFHEQSVEFATRLIQTKSISCNEKAVADLYMHELERLGYDNVFRDDMGNVVGIISLTDCGPSIMYNSHMDHVDAGEISNWDGYDPYGGTIDECEVDNQDASEKELSRCIHGRAASDVKGGAAVAVYAGAILLALRNLGFPLKGKFIFTGVVQEEPAESAGMSYLVDTTFPQRGISYDAMVSSEATALKLMLGSRGRVELLITVYGRTSHGSAPWRGINAIEKAVPVLLAIQELAKTLPADEDLGIATITPTIISCSPGQLSIVPDRCVLSIDRRLLPNETVEIAVGQIQSVLHSIADRDPEFKADVKVNSALQTSYTGITQALPKAMPAWKISQDHPCVLACVDALQVVGQEVAFGYWDFCTDASKTAGIDRKPCIGYSPMQEQYAHTPYDKVRCDYMLEALEGNVAIYLALSNQAKQAFQLI
ncbi:MAG: family metallo-hydrolase [Anaerosporomusa subterranea]|jgi:putative selenium metabolism hydrolase|nr:family metallo-hydrolase [Anaerosporomusa subterranea]